MHPNFHAVKNKIIEQATEMFLNIGFKSATMDDIAQKMGISKKTIYAYFKTKSKLVEASVQLIFNEITTAISDLQEEELNPVIEIFQMKELANKMLKNEKTSPHFQLQKYYPRIYDKFRNKQFDVTQQFVINNLQRGITTGHYRSDIPISFISRLHFVGMLSIKDQNLFPEEEYTNLKLMEYFLEYHLRAIVNEKGLKTLNKILKNKEQNNA